MKGACLLHDKSCLHTARAVTQELLQKFDWDVLARLSHIPDLAPNDYHLFTRLKEIYGGKRFENNEKLQQFTETRRRNVAGDDYEAGIEKLIRQYVHRT